MNLQISIYSVCAFSGVLALAGHLIRGRREARALSIDERNRQPESDAAKDISRIIGSFHSSGQSKQDLG